LGKLKVAVLMGGRSEEREISLKTGTGIMKALDPDRFQAIALDTGGERPPLTNAAPDALPPSDESAEASEASAGTALVQPQGDLLDSVTRKKDGRYVVFMSLLV
jgi:D-alanine-D-alanine ligase